MLTSKTPPAGVMYQPEGNCNATGTWGIDMRFGCLGLFVCLSVFKYIEKFFLLRFLFYVNEFFSDMYICAPRVCLVPTEARRKCQIPETGVMESFKLSCDFWKTNLSLLE